MGHGAPASARGLDFLGFVAGLGFTGVLLGPAGMTSPGNPSPYDSTSFARNPLALSFARLAGPEWGGVLDARLLASLAAARPPGDRCDHAFAHAAAGRLLDALAAAVRAHPERVPEVAARRATFERENAWLAHDAAYEPTPEAAERFRLAQLACAEQHETFRAAARGQGLRLYADAQVGTSPRDLFGRQSLFLRGYHMGAPPSRTNPEGQPWGFPVLDPAQLDEGGAARALFEARLELLLRHHDGVRIDHPHGWVCPWVYTDDVQRGARLFSSPDLPDHPALAAYARVRPDQLDRSLPRYHDHFVRHLEPAQVDAYATLFDAAVARARAHGRDAHDLVCEVLSTCPRPLEAVLARHGLGRFRVTQKARLDDPADVYRAENARPEDWIMPGTHDTPPLRRVVAGWLGTPEAERRAAHLGARLRTDADVLARDPGALTEALIAELFLGPARNVLLFWVDLFGGTDIYNRPGVISPDNWTLRVPADFERAYRGAVARREAPSLPRALSLALRARGADADPDGRALLAQLAAHTKGH